MLSESQANILYAANVCRILFMAQVTLLKLISCWNIVKTVSWELTTFSIVRLFGLVLADVNASVKLILMAQMLW